MGSTIIDHVTGASHLMFEPSANFITGSVPITVAVWSYGACYFTLKLIRVE